LPFTRSRCSRRLTANLTDRSRQPVDGDERPRFGVVGYNVQVAVDTEASSDCGARGHEQRLRSGATCNMAKQAKGVLKTETLEAVADRGYFSGPEILACHEAGITVTLPKPQTSAPNRRGASGKQGLCVFARDDAYRCPAGERLPYRYTNEEDGKMLRRYWTTACQIVRSNRMHDRARARITRWEA